MAPNPPKPPVAVPEPKAEVPNADVAPEAEPNADCPNAEPVLDVAPDPNAEVPKALGFDTWPKADVVVLGLGAAAAVGAAAGVVPCVWPNAEAGLLAGVDEPD